MVIPTFISYTGFVACVILAVIALVQGPGKTLNRLFFLMSIFLCSIMLLANFSYTAETREAVEFFYKTASFFFSFYFAINLHFNLVFTRHTLKKWQYMILYLPAGVVIFTTFFDYSLFSDFVLYRGQWEFIPAYGTFGFGFYILYSISYLLASIVLIERYRRTTEINKEKQQALIIISAYIFMTVAGPTLAFLLPLLGIYHLSIYNTNTVIVYLIAVYYAVFKFGFLNLTPSIMADEIITNISDMIVIANTNRTISSINEPCAKRLHRSRNSVQNLRLYDLVSSDTDIDGILNELLHSDKKSIDSHIRFKYDNEEIITDSYISKIYDRFGDHSGYLIIARENRGKEQFQNDYNITEREFQIINMVLSGLSNKMIGKKLGISERTVETHRMNVYAKIGINDRIELFKIAGEYNLVQ